jgi:mono/diheme cytochrome c family protein
MKAFHRVQTALLSGLLLLSGAALAQDADAVARGKSKFQHSCEPCHGRGVGDDGRAMLPGTDALRIKYQGALPPALEDRSDLTAEVLKTYVRMGSWSMPPFRKTELSDAEIVDIAAYLAASSRSSP